MHAAAGCAPLQFAVFHACAPPCAPARVLLVPSRFNANLGMVYNISTFFHMCFVCSSSY